MKFRFTFLTLLTLFLTSGLFAQNRVANKENAPFAKITEQSINQNARAMEGVSPPSFGDDCSLSVTGYTISDNIWGFVVGTNDYGDLEKAQLLEFTGSATYSVIAVFASFSDYSAVGNGEIRAKIYAYDEDSGLPGELLGTSDSTLVSDIAPTDSIVQFTPFLFLGDQAPIVNNSSFVASIDISALYETEDTVGIFHTNDSCGFGGDSFERWLEGDVWVRMDTAWGLNLDFIITAVVEFDEATSADEFVKHNGLELYPASPNPARYTTNLNYGLDKVDKVTIDIFDAQGKRIKSLERQGQSTGRHQEQILTHDMSAGTYFYRISNSAGSLVSRFVVQQ